MHCSLICDVTYTLCFLIIKYFETKTRAHTRIIARRFSINIKLNLNATNKFKMVFTFKFRAKMEITFEADSPDHVIQFHLFVPATAILFLRTLHYVTTTIRTFNNPLHNFSIFDITSQIMLIHAGRDERPVSSRRSPAAIGRRSPFGRGSTNKIPRDTEICFAVTWPILTSSA